MSMLESHICEDEISGSSCDSSSDDSDNEDDVSNDAIYNNGNENAELTLLDDYENSDLILPPCVFENNAEESDRGTLLNIIHYLCIVLL